MGYRSGDGAEGRIASASIFTYPDRETADAFAGLLRELGATAAAVPEDERVRGRMVWRVRVPEAEAERVRALVEAMTRD